MIPDDTQFPIPNDEPERLEALRRYGAFGLLRSTVFDDIARLAAFICRTPLSMISLIDSNRQWFLAKNGIDSCETSREASFCAHALVGNEMLIVEDARVDARFARNIMVTEEPFIRFYAGAPLLTAEGYALGTLCVVDYVPRILSIEQIDALRSLSHLVMTQLESSRLKREMRVLKQSLTLRPAPR
ncbi:MAG: GAF domain-containing protein [Janthinobacterium lividum]